MRLPVLAAFAICAVLALSWGLGVLSLGSLGAPALETNGNLFGVLAGSSLLGRGLLPALLFGGSFLVLPVALVVGGIAGMMRNAPPRPPRAKRSWRRAKATAAEPARAV